jgi:hypothetical protein
MVLTERGRLLVKYLDQQGWVVEKFNDDVFIGTGPSAEDEKE